jgi:REP element-mobilizing transposase RayT
MEKARKEVGRRDVGAPSQPRGWYSRGYLPHFDGGELAQFVTFRLHDSLPQSLLHRWRQELEAESDEVAKKLLFQRVEGYLDQGYGNCHFKDSRIATQVQDALLHFDGERYRLSAWVIMPNHVHLLFTPLAGHELWAIIKSLKSYTSHQANQLLGRTGAFWQREYFDRYSRDANHYEKVCAYIANNPVKAGLCESPEAWPYSNAGYWERRRLVGEA